VGRDGIEPPTLRFSVVGPDVQQRAGSMTVLVRWHAAEQAHACLGRILSLTASLTADSARLVSTSVRPTNNRVAHAPAMVPRGLPRPLSRAAVGAYTEQPEHSSASRPTRRRCRLRCGSTSRRRTPFIGVDAPARQRERVHHVLLLALAAIAVR
jgi:hypothetical protein